MFSHHLPGNEEELLVMIEEKDREIEQIREKLVEVRRTSTQRSRLLLKQPQALQVADDSLGAMAKKVTLKDLLDLLEGVFDTTFFETPAGLRVAQLTLVELVFAMQQEHTGSEAVAEEKVDTRGNAAYRSI